MVLLFHLNSPQTSSFWEVSSSYQGIWNPDPCLYPANYFVKSESVFYLKIACVSHIFRNTRPFRQRFAYLNKNCDRDISSFSVLKLKTYSLNSLFHLHLFKESLFLIHLIIYFTSISHLFSYHVISIINIRILQIDR